MFSVLFLKRALSGGGSFQVVEMQFLHLLSSDKQTLMMEKKSDDGIVMKLPVGGHSSKLNS
jgi:hypothetical protein